MYEAELYVEKNYCPKYLESGSYKRHFYRSKKYINILLSSFGTCLLFFRFRLDN